MSQINNTDYPKLLLNNQLFRNGVESIQNDPQFNWFRNNPYFMQTLDIIQNHPGFAANTMMHFAQSLPGMMGNSLMEAGEIMQSVYTQPNSQDVSIGPSAVDNLQCEEIQLDKKIETQENQYRKYKESRKQLIAENDSLMKKLNQDSQNIEEIPPDAKNCLDAVKQLNDNVDKDQNRYREAKNDSDKINCLKSIIEFKKKKSKNLEQLIEIYKNTEEDLRGANKLLEENIDVEITEQTSNMESSNQVNSDPTSSINISKPSLFEKMVQVSTGIKDENDMKPDMQQDNENLK